MTETFTDSLRRGATQDLGKREFEAVFNAAGNRAANGMALDPDEFLRRLGIRGLTYAIERVLDEHYPADIFGDGSDVYPSWRGDRGGSDIDPGIRWCALLRAAIKEVP